VHFPPGPKEWDGLLSDRHSGAGARITAGIGSSFARRKHAEAADFDPVSAAQGRIDRAQYSLDETFYVALVEMRILRGDAVDELGFDHRVVPPTRL
jgi:hypothetical protein